MKKKVCLFLIMILIFSSSVFAKGLEVSVPNGYSIDKSEIERLNLVINNKMKEENNERENLIGYVIPIYNLSTEYLFNNTKKTLEDSFVNKGNAIMIVKDKVGPFMQVGLIKSSKGLIVETYSDIAPGLEEAITLLKTKSMTKPRYLSLDQTSKPSFILATEGKVDKAISIDLLNDKEKNNIKVEDAILNPQEVYEQVKANKIEDMELTVQNLKDGKAYKTDQVPLFNSNKIAKNSSGNNIVMIILIALVVLALIFALYYFLVNKSTKKVNFRKKKIKRNLDEESEPDESSDYFE